jgi:lipid-binding SYLF domain-containing protein
MGWNMPAPGRRVGALVIASALLTAVVARAQVASEAGAETRRINDAAAVLATVAGAGANSIPRAVLDKAEAVAVFPYVAQGPRASGQGRNQIRGDLQIGIRARGIVSVRNEAGVWSPPAFVTLNGGGRHNADLVFLIPHRKGVDAILGGDQFALGDDGATAAGPLSGAAAPDVTVLVYSQPRDWAAKTTFKGVTLSRDSASNQTFYGKPLTSRQVVAQADGPEPVGAWRAALEKHVR